jgi:hypothetical protein
MTTATLDEVAKKKPAELSAEQQVAVELFPLGPRARLVFDGPGRVVEAAD